MKSIYINSKEDTIAFARKLAKSIKDNLFICLKGDLGAGKTFFTKAFTKELGYLDEVTSPTFSLMNIYEGPFRIYHYDLYRLNNDEELYDIGFYEYICLEDKEIAIVEWPDNFLECMPKDFLLIDIEKVSEEKRIFHIYLSGTKYEEIYKEL